MPATPAWLGATTPSELGAGRIVGVFGLRGECKIDATRVGTDVLAAGLVVDVRLRDGTRRDLRIRSIRLHQGRPLAAFVGFDDADAAEALVGARILVDRADVTLRPGEYLDSDLIGCVVVGGSGVDIGGVVGVEHYPAQDMLVIGPARTLVPLVGAFVTSIDIAAKRIKVDLPPGLLDERDADLA